MKLSVVLATYNEEKNIAACLDSVNDLADEIVVVDGTSSDRTVNIAKQFGAKVIITDNPPIFHINKQKAIDAATGEWILQLDADETLTQELKNEIRNAVASKTVNGYWIPRKNYFLGRYLMKGGVYPDYTMRLYRKGKGKLPQKDVHEQAIVEGTTKKLHHPLLHMADPTFSRYLVRFGRYTDLLANEIGQELNSKSLSTLVKFLMIRPTSWFLWTYFRHKGFLDSWQGFVFSFFSAMRFPVAYMKFLQKK